MFSTPLYKHRGEELLDDMVRVCLVLLETTTLASKVALHAHQQSINVPVALDPHLYLLFSVFQILAVLTGMQWRLVVSICFFLMIYDVEHLFICLCALCVSFSC